MAVVAVRHGLEGIREQVLENIDKLLPVAYGMGKIRLNDHLASALLEARLVRLRQDRTQCRPPEMHAVRTVQPAQGNREGTLVAERLRDAQRAVDEARLRREQVDAHVVAGEIAHGERGFDATDAATRDQYSRWNGHAVSSAGRIIATDQTRFGGPWRPLPPDVELRATTEPERRSAGMALGG